MKNIICIVFSLVILNFAKAQSTASNLIDGGRTLIELISVLKKNKASSNVLASPANTIDSCAVKQQSDLCFKNSSSKDLAISLYKRTDTGYEAKPFTVKVLPKKQECLYELKSGIYKYRIETGDAAVRQLLSEGEFKLQPCDNMKREIKE